MICIHIIYNYMYNTHMFRSTLELNVKSLDMITNTSKYLCSCLSPCRASFGLSGSENISPIDMNILWYAPVSVKPKYDLRFRLAIIPLWPP